MRRVAADFGPIPEYAGESLDRVAKLTEADYPLDGKYFAFRAESGGHSLCRIETISDSSSCSSPRTSASQKFANLPRKPWARA